ncbi:MAG: phosphoribosylaminoimidazolesuccinocarboxamide synthase [Candidatus Omnitrophica bacterium]|nr:phosphoribosylaminoimidazolesuccinocarboxamide synthase [Candidatus Omnitrophota bacterium]MBU1128079.1 phosphoribosylaminoimidazolesuccinocarboxamide synthase [Candidatus Omnitrophota bacterium]MBU1785043.1 phosphoribosylaminoimidazolesuccinocarboxamide synthase [Candidatus Omnitrophota bacterium]MBU1851891.1 phosphoribosylaminoimidazolesuccinocarboxamide synthase [Candidatus Omnitrophota bacterium]
MCRALLDLDLPLPLFRQGKVRNVYDLGDKLLFVATDRISAFDVIMANGIPEKGKVLNMISVFWFDLTKNITPNHVITSDIDEIISVEPRLFEYRDILDARSMLVKKAEPIPVECIIRGYISGSGWKDYKKTGKVCDIDIPEGLKESDKLGEPIFTPSTKADSGHDENISQQEAMDRVGADVFKLLKEKSVAIYETARDHAASRGIIIADTKFEFGKIGDEIILMDEVLTPDSSRFWPAAEYAAGEPQKSFDKQFVRDYLETLDWDKTPPGPELPLDIVQKTAEKYREVYKILTGKEL